MKKIPMIFLLLSSISGMFAVPVATYLGDFKNYLDSIYKSKQGYEQRIDPQDNQTAITILSRMKDYLKNDSKQERVAGIAAIQQKYGIMISAEWIDSNLARLGVYN